LGREVFGPPTRGRKVGLRAKKNIGGYRVQKKNGSGKIESWWGQVDRIRKVRKGELGGEVIVEDKERRKGWRGTGRGEAKAPNGDEGTTVVGEGRGGGGARMFLGAK